MTKIVGIASGTKNIVDSGSLTAVAAGTATLDSATKVVLDVGGGKTYTMTGTGFGGFDANGIPTTGTVTGMVPNGGGTWSGFSISVSSLWTILQAGDINGFNNAFFSGNDTFVSHAAAGNTDKFSGFGGDDSFNMVNAASGANSQISGGDGNDYISFAANLDPTANQIDGGAGTDTLALAGDYSGGLVFGATTMVNVEKISLTAGFSYNLTTNDATVASGQTLTVYGSTLHSGDTLTFNGAAETDGKFIVDGGAGNDTITTGAGKDVINLSTGGNDTVHGGGGNDNFNFNAAFTAADSVDGGAGVDTMTLNGDYSGGITFGASTISNLENINLTAGHSYNLTTNDANVGSGQTLKINGSMLGLNDVLTFNGSAEANGRFVIYGGKGNDTITGGSKGDSIHGGGGADHLTGGPGGDYFVYASVSDSIGSANNGPAGSGFDTITDFNTANDRIDLPFTVTGINTAVTSGPLHQPLFDTDLGNTLGSSQLAAYHAVLYSPSTGDYNGHTFLIVDGNGIAGYQSAGDLVIDVTGGSNLASLSTADFI